MATTVEVPKLGNTVEDCLIAAWRKHKGDTVSAGEVIAEMETDKTNFELTAPVDGVVLETYFEEGALVPVFSVICAIGTAGESTAGLGPAPAPAPGGGAGPEPAGAGPALTAPAQAAPALTAPAGTGAAPGAAHLSPRARRFAAEHDLGAAAAEGTGPGGRVLEADLWRLLAAPPDRPGPGPATGPAGPATGPAGPAPVAPVAPAPPAPPAPLAPRGGAPLSSVRQRIAKRLRESLASTAQYTLNSSANAAGLLAVRQKMKASPATAGININDLVVYCTVAALVQEPSVNAELVDGTVYGSDEVNVGFACDTERGLVVPVVRGAQDLSLAGLARRLKELAARAGAGTLAPEDMAGGTFTVSNLGPLGIEHFTPVLNPPQVAILGVGAIGLKPVRKADGNVELIDSIALSLTADHQVIDGAPGARFLGVVRAKIEAVQALCTT